MNNPFGTKDASPILRVEDDGVTHINIYSRGATDLGQFLSHFRRAPFNHPYYGRFTSMEGLWYYLSSAERDHTNLKDCYGYEAKLRGRLCYTRRLVPGFKEIIIDANARKIMEYPEYAEQMKESVLPFKHYYLNRNSPVANELTRFDWLVEGFEEIRSLLKQGLSWPATIDWKELDPYSLETQQHRTLDPEEVRSKVEGEMNRRRFL